MAHGPESWFDHGNDENTQYNDIPVVEDILQSTDYYYCYIIFLIILMFMSGVRRTGDHVRIQVYTGESPIVMVYF